jgi:sugar lactone lactonase YvrE
MMVQPTLEVLCQTDDALGEGPLWDHRTESLLWLDILRGRVHCWSVSTGLKDILQIDALIGSIALAGRFDLLLATSEGLFRRDGLSGETRLLANPIAGKPLSFNDGRVDALGRFWVGTMAINAAHYGNPWGALYRYDPDGSLYRMEEGLTISNGLDWSPDNKTLYLTDTMRLAIYAYDFDLESGTIANRRIFARTAESGSYPDGLVVDCEGYVWSAGFGGSVISRYDAAGRCVQHVGTPVSCPTSLSFGGANFATAYITTARHVLSRGHTEQGAGALFTMELGAIGRAANVFDLGPHH